MVMNAAKKFELESVIAGSAMHDDGVLARDGWLLDWRGVRQALPSGAVPLKAGGAAIAGQGWTAAEVERYAEVVQGFCIFERKGRE